MAQRLKVRALDPQIESDIRRRRYSYADMRQIRRNIKHPRDEVAEWSFVELKAVITAIAVLFAAGGVFIFVRRGMSPGVIVCAVLAALVLLVRFVFGWFANGGLIKRQFNNAIKEGYPKYYDELKF